jgi:hypothetical protein
MLALTSSRRQRPAPGSQRPPVGSSPTLQCGCSSHSDPRSTVLVWLLPGTASSAMLAVGVVEVVAGLVVAVRPRIGGYLVAWLAGIIGNLLLLGDRYDVALRDLGLLLAALALARLTTAFQPTHGAKQL